MFHIELYHISTFYVLTAFIISFLSYIKVLDQYQLYCNYELIFQGHQYWRLFTSLLYFEELSTKSIAMLLTFANYASSCEVLYFSTRPLDFIVFSIFAAASAMLTGWICGRVIFSMDFYFFFVCYKSKRAVDNQFAVFDIILSQSFLPFFIILLTWIAGDSIKSLVLIYLFSQLYFIVHDVINIKYGTHLLRCPESANKFLRKLLLKIKFD